MDDHPENLKVLEAILSPLGENLVCARSGVEALRHVLTTDFALILMDVQMPSMHGFETATLIRSREKSAHIPIIFLTAISRDLESMFQGYAVGAVDYISKPFNPTVLAAKVRVFVDLFKKNEEIKRQAQLLYESELREAERHLRERDAERELESQKAHQLELELRVAERTSQLVAANAEMEAFCYSVSHDLRSPLRGIVSTSRILLEDAKDKLSPSDVEQLQRQSNAANKLGLLIDDLLRLFRLGQKKVAPVEVDISGLAREIASELSARYLDRKVVVDIEPGLQACADQGLVRILLHNLLDNAYKYSPKGGHIRLTQSAEVPTEYVLTDSGIGFDMRYAEKLFLPFERLVIDSEFPGTGIGLAIVRRIVQRHGGRISAESTPTAGATFRFTLGQ